MYRECEKTLNNLMTHVIITIMYFKLHFNMSVYNIVSTAIVGYTARNKNDTDCNKPGPLLNSQAIIKLMRNISSILEG